jgi:hypothetical protein
MSKRFTDTEKYHDPWFRSLSVKHKCLWLYLWDECDHIGIWKVDFGLATFFVGEKITSEDLAVINSEKERIHEISPELQFIIGYPEFQYGDKILHPKNNLHRSAARRIQEIENLYVTLPLLFPHSSGTLQEQDSESDSERESVIVEDSVTVTASVMDSADSSLNESSPNDFINRPSQNSASINKNIQPLAGDWYKHENKT